MHPVGREILQDKGIGMRIMGMILHTEDFDSENVKYTIRTEEDEIGDLIFSRNELVLLLILHICPMQLSSRNK